MSNSAGPKITKDGLVLDFDAANPKSYNFYADPYASNVSLYLQMNGANGSTTFTDSSPNALAVTAVGNAQISTAQSKYNGTSAYFDGTGDYLNIVSSSYFNLPADFTVECWFNTSNGTSSQQVIAGKWTGTGNVAWTVVINAGTSQILLGTANSGSFVATLTFTATSTITTNTWHHLAVVRSGSAVLVFLNGVQAGASQTSTSNLTASDSNALTIGQFQGINYFTGYIDELKITKGIAKYTASFTSPPIPSTCTDLTRSKNVGTLTGGVDYNFSNGGSLVFDGSNDYLTSPSSSLFNFGTGDFTIDVWAKVNGYSAGSIQTLINTYINPSNGWNIQFNVFNTLDFRFSYGDTTLIISGANAILLNEWNHLTISRISNSLKMYVNGNNIVSATDSTNISNGGALVSGRLSASAIQFLNGNIAMVKIYKARGLTSTEVYNNFVANRGRFFVSTPATLPVSGAALWLDASRQATLFTDAGTTQVATSGQSIYQWNDLSGNNRHATQTTLGNRPTWVAPVNGQNGLGVVSFNGSNQLITATSGLSAQPFEYYIVFKFKSTTTNDRIVFGAGDKGNFDGNSGGGWNLYSGALLAGGIRTGTSWAMANCKFNGSSSALRINASSVLSGNAGLGTPTTLSLAGNGSTDWGDVVVAEFIVYPTTLSSGDQNLVESYLKTKWGTP
jgi:hypothetical protein